MNNSLKFLTFCSMILSTITYTMEEKYNRDNTEKDDHVYLEAQFSYLNDLWKPDKSPNLHVNPWTPQHHHNPQSPRFHSVTSQAIHQNIPGINQKGTYYPAPSGAYYNASASPYYPIAHQTELAERSLKCSEAALCMNLVRLHDEHPSEPLLKEANGYALVYLKEWTKEIHQQKSIQKR